MGDPFSAAPTEFPNREKLPFAARTFLGALPILWVVIAVVVLLLLAVSTAASAGADLVLAAMALLTIGLVAIVVIGARAIPQRTPTSVRLESSALLALWKGPDARSESIAFERITAVEPRKWRWTSGKGGYAHFVPSVVRFETRPGEAGPDSTEGADEGVVYLTDENASRVESALKNWSRGLPAGSPSALPTATEVARKRWQPGPAVWSECMRCGGPLEGEAERESGICSGCRTLAA